MTRQFHYRPKTPSVAIMRVLAYILLSMSCNRTSVRTNSDTYVASTIQRNSLALGSLTDFDSVEYITMPDFEINSSILDTNDTMSAFSVIPTKPRIRRFRRKRQRRVPRETYLSKLDELDRELNEEKKTSLKSCATRTATFTPNNVLEILAHVTVSS